MCSWGIPASMGFPKGLPVVKVFAPWLGANTPQSAGICQYAQNCGRHFRYPTEAVATQVLVSDKRTLSDTKNLACVLTFAYFCCTFQYISAEAMRIDIRIL